MDISDEAIEASRTRLGLSSDYEWYTCAAQCGDIVWVPPGMGDQPVAPVCSELCLAKYVLACQLGKGIVDGQLGV